MHCYTSKQVVGQGKDAYTAILAFMIEKIIKNKLICVQKPTNMNYTCDFLTLCKMVIVAVGLYPTDAARSYRSSLTVIIFRQYFN